MSESKPILLVEDDPSDLELEQIPLAEIGLADQVLIVRGGEQSLDYLYRRGRFQDRSEENPLAVLLDLKMPRVGGLEVLRRPAAGKNRGGLPLH